MIRYVNADKLWEEIESEDIYTGFESACIFKMVREKINNAPAADVEEVTRCKDCKYCDKEGECVYWCNRIRSRCQLTTPDDYCSRGRKRNER